MTGENLKEAAEQSVKLCIVELVSDTPVPLQSWCSQLI
jgi:hypothetical protein